MVEVGHEAIDTSFVSFFEILAASTGSKIGKIGLLCETRLGSPDLILTTGCLDQVALALPSYIGSWPDRQLWFRAGRPFKPKSSKRMLIAGSVGRIPIDKSIS